MAKDSGRSCMGRAVIHHSPDKHPEQSDPYAEMDRQTEEAAKRSTGTYENSRKVMKPMQSDMPRDTSKSIIDSTLDYISGLAGGKRK